MTHDNPTDILRIDETWAPDHQALVAPVRRFVEEDVLPRIARCHQHESFPEELIAPLKALGILEAVADASLDPITYGLISRELERGSSTLRSFLSVQGSLVIGAIQQFGSTEQQNQWLGPLGRLDAWGCFGLTEPDCGSNPAGMQTRAERTAGGFRLTGAKCWITNGVRANVAVIWAKLDGQVCGFLVETDRPGFSATLMKGKWSFRSSETAQLFLDGVEVPESALLPGANSLGAALKCLARARYTIAWGVCGAAAACLEETLAYLKDRTQFGGKPLASHQLIQYKLAWMAADLAAMTLIAKQLGDIKATGEPEPAQIALAKMHNCRKALEIARTCRELLGANGIHDEYHIGRRMVDLETVLTYEGTENIHALTIGAAMTGIKAFE
ncbi:MAG: acyl-CoA dehydrogenase family protein [Candidatus Hydrogenedentes bacterium]|nr:acyl-CoA dehydrogenase family protein [Candidatus Hydrogenedentota bacterium]